MTDDKRRRIAFKLREAREASGLSQGQVAKLMGKHRPTISEIEAGRRKVTAEELTQFSDLYGVSVSWVTSDDDKPSDLNEDKILMAARSLSSMKDEDLDRLMSLIHMIKKSDGDKQN